jgi:hypothetical protein
VPALQRGSPQADGEGFRDRRRRKKAGDRDHLHWNSRAGTPDHHDPSGAEFRSVPDAHGRDRLRSNEHHNDPSDRVSRRVLQRNQKQHTALLGAGS